MTRRQRPLVAFLVLSCGIVVTAWAGPQGRHFPDSPRPMEEEPEDLPDLSSYRVLTVTQFTSPEDANTERPVEVAEDLPDQLAEALRKEDLGMEIRTGAPSGAPDELVLRGKVLVAKRGSRAGRYFVGPLAQAKVSVEFELVDGASGNQLAEETVTRRWGWPGLSGVVRGLPGVVKRTSAGIADYVKRARS